jgi:hypothetical protein
MVAEVMPSRFFWTAFFIDFIGNKKKGLSPSRKRENNRISEISYAFLCVLSVLCEK